VKDLVKWGTVYSLAEREAKNAPVVVVFAPMIRPDYPKYQKRALTNGASIPDRVYDHFRDLGEIEQLKWPTNVSFAPFWDKFRGSKKGRQEYFSALGDFIRSVTPEQPHRLILFIDPDNGIEPPGGAQGKHVARAELAVLGKSLKTGDLLVLYQHHRIGDSNWLSDACRAFEKAIGATPGSTTTYQSPALTNAMAVLVQVIR
jgi:hypothetical protein